MLNLIFVTLFPSYFQEYFKISLAKKAIKEKILSFQTYNIRDYSFNGKSDDYPYGGGRGMLIKIEPLVKTLATIEEKYEDLYIVLLSPQGKTFEQKDVERLVKKENIVFICGHYEGFDQRINNYVDEQISIGNFITMGGELPSLVISESLIRAIPNFIHPESFQKESFSESKFDYDTYTRPEEFDGLKIPDVLKSGNHKNIENWRKETSIKKEENNLEINKKKKKLPNLNNWRLSNFIKI